MAVNLLNHSILCARPVERKLWQRARRHVVVAAAGARVAAVHAALPARRERGGGVGLRLKSRRRVLFSPLPEERERERELFPKASAFVCGQHHAASVGSEHILASLNPAHGGARRHRASWQRVGEEPRALVRLLQPGRVRRGRAAAVSGVRQAAAHNSARAGARTACAATISLHAARTWPGTR